MKNSKNCFFKKMSVKYNIIVAATEKGGIGLNKGLPWRIKGDMKYFKDVTTGDDKGMLFFARTYEPLF